MLTRSFRSAPSPSPRTPRTRLSASHKSSHCSSSAPARSICAHTRCPPSPESLAKAAARLAARHSRLYPITTSLGIDGVKKIKRRTVQEHIHARAEELAPRPSEDVWLPVDYQGHDLQGPILNTGFTTRNDEVIVQWLPAMLHQSAGSEAGIYDMSSPFLLTSAPTRNYNDYYKLALNFGPFNVALRLLLLLYRHLLPHRLLPPFPFRSLQLFTATHLLLLLLPLQFRRTLHFDYGGYGGAHYSSDGYIIRRSPSSSTSSVNNESDDDGIFGELQYPADVTLDMCTPVLLFAWYDTDKPPIQMTIQPRLQGLSGVCHGEIVLQDFQRGLEAVGLPVDIAIERFMDATDHWVITDWARAIPIYAHNRVIYIKALGLEVTPPNHFIKLFD
ncbi:hypothetical protein C8R44DRAFT_881445 [Mycena epipterygia]|nr:hypothetical protein C8R44DRAFT_881445 [Mycena epipterygia]